MLPRPRASALAQRQAHLAIVLPPKGRREFAQGSACAELIAKQEEPLRVRRRWPGKGNATED